MPYDAAKPRHGEGLWSLLTRIMYTDWRTLPNGQPADEDKHGRWCVEALWDGSAPPAVADALGLEPIDAVVNGRPVDSDDGPRAGPTAGRDYSALYDSRTVSMVLDADAKMMCALGYTEPFKPSGRGPVVRFTDAELGAVL